MNKTVTYTWTEELGRRAIKAQYERKEARLWLWAVGGSILMIAGWWNYYCTKAPVSMIMGVFGLLWLSFPLRIYFQCRRLTKDLSKLVGERIVTIIFGDDEFTITRGKNTISTEWKRLTKVVDGKEFLIVMCGKLSVAMLPKEFMDTEQIAFIKSKVANNKT